MKVIFMGTPDFSVGTLEALAEAGHEVVLAVTQPDKPKGRGGKMQYTPVKEAALAWGIPVYQPKKVSGVTTMQMNEGLDTGDMILKTEIPLDPKETGGSLHDKLAEAGAKLCVETLKCLEDKTATWEPQGESTTAYAKMLDKNLGNINWNDPAVQIERLIRGLNPWPSAYTHWNDKVIKLWQADVVEDNTDQEAGTIVKVEKDSFYVQTGEGLLKIEELQLQGKKRMDAGAFLRGNHLEYGEILKKC